MPSKKLSCFALVLGLFLAALFLKSPKATAAACAQPSTDLGTVTSTVTIPATGTYRVWSRIQVPDTTNNSYLLEISNGTTANCYTVGDNSSIPTDDWTWVDYQNGTTTNKINASLSAGTYTVKMIGNADGVALDRVIFTADTACTPTGTGDDCADPPDTTNPLVSITSPANGNTVSGTTTITASASDDSGTISKVEFYVDGALIGTDSSSSYSYPWDTTTASPGSHVVMAKAYDPSGNTSTSTISVTVANGSPDLVVTGVSWSPTNPNVGQLVTLSAVVKNQGTVASAPGSTKFTVDGVTVSTVSDPASLAAGASRTETATATWTAVAGSHTVLATADNDGTITESNEANNTLSTTMAVSNNDVVAPTVSVTAPTNGATVLGTVAVTVAATDNVGGSGMSRVEYYIGTSSTPTATDPNSPYSYSWVTTSGVTNGTYNISAKAYDNAGNVATSSTITVTVNNPAPPKVGDINNDSKVDGRDISVILSHWGASGMSLAQGDVSGDGSVNGFDLSIVLSKWSP